MAIDRNMRLVYIDRMGQALDVTVGELIDGVKALVLQDLKTDDALTSAIAGAVASHLTATVRPT